MKLLLLGLLFTSQVNAEITWDNKIKNLFQAKCIACHNNKYLGDFNKYEDAFKRKNKILDRVVIKKDMPLGGKLTDKERAEVKEWIENGAKK